MLTEGVHMPKAKSASKDTTMAIVAYVLFFVPLLTDAKKDPFVKFHVKQGLVLFIAMFGWELARKVFWYIPVLGWFVGLASVFVYIFLLFLIIKGILNAANGKQEELPVIGKYAKQFTF